MNWKTLNVGLVMMLFSFVVSVENTGESLQAHPFNATHLYVEYNSSYQAFRQIIFNDRVIVEKKIINNIFEANVCQKMSTANDSLYTAISIEDQLLTINYDPKDLFEAILEQALCKDYENEMSLLYLNPTVIPSYLKGCFENLVFQAKVGNDEKFFYTNASVMEPLSFEEVEIGIGKVSTILLEDMDFDLIQACWTSTSIASVTSFSVGIVVAIGLIIGMIIWKKRQSRRKRFSRQDSYGGYYHFYQEGPRERQVNYYGQDNFSDYYGMNDYYYESDM